MKRSEMFSLLRKEILNSNIYALMETHSINHDHLVDKDVKSILDALEKAGMQPPNVTLDQLVPGFLSSPSDDYYACWEPEDET